MRFSLEEAVFGEPANIKIDLSLERRLFSEIMMKVFKLEKAIGDNETLGLQIGDITMDLR